MREFEIGETTLKFVQDGPQTTVVKHDGEDPLLGVQITDNAIWVCVNGQNVFRGRGFREVHVTDMRVPDSPEVSEQSSAVLKYIQLWCSLADPYNKEGEDKARKMMDEIWRRLDGRQVQTIQQVMAVLDKEA